MSLIVRAGAFFFYFAIVLGVLIALIALSIVPLASQLGVGVPSVVDSMLKLFIFSTLLSPLIAVASGLVLGAIIPQLRDIQALWFILKYFLPIYPVVATVIGQLIALLDIPAPAKAALIAVSNTVVGFTMVYYIAYRAGLVPQM